MNLTWLDNNSWLIELGGQRVLLDPWLRGKLVFGGAEWLFRAEHRQPQAIPEAIDAILLSQGLEDHAHPETLKALDRSIPVIASPNAAKVVRELNYTSVTELAHGEKHVLGDRLEIQAMPGSPIGPMLVENAYILRDLQAATSLYYEPHGFHSEQLQQVEHIDVAISPMADVKIPLLGAILKGADSAAKLAQWIRPQVMLPSAAPGDTEYAGLLAKLLKAEGGPDVLRSRLTELGLSTKVMEPTPGERFSPAIDSLLQHS
ncbi:MAG: MBL fold metallo-hydrolase [Cyanobacteria bacterium J06642_2]